MVAQRLASLGDKLDQRKHCLVTRCGNTPHSPPRLRAGLAPRHLRRVERELLPLLHSCKRAEAPPPSCITTAYAPASRRGAFGALSESGRRCAWATEGGEDECNDPVGSIHNVIAPIICQERATRRLSAEALALSTCTKTLVSAHVLSQHPGPTSLSEKYLPVIPRQDEVS
jgi:hypothetical protein